MIEFDPHHRIDLTGPWAGFSFLGDRLVTPEGRELLPEDLAWLSLTACQAQEWRRMMEAARSAPAFAIILPLSSICGMWSAVAKSVRRWRWLALTPSLPQQSSRYRGRDHASACEAFP